MDKLKCLEILGLQENPTEDEVKAAYRRLAKQWHPDKNPDNPNAKYKFNEVHQAMKTLLEDEEDIAEIIDPMEMFNRVVLERYLKKYFFPFGMNEADLFSGSYYFDEEDGDCLNFFKKSGRYSNRYMYSGDMNYDDPILEEARHYKSFNDWKEAQKTKRKQKMKESAPVRPKQLKKKQQDHLDYQRDRESAKIREELMNKMEEKRIKVEKMLQKEEEKRREVKEEMQRNLVETLARTQLCAKVEPPKPQVSFKKPKSKARTRKEKFKVVSSGSDDNQEMTSCTGNSVDVQNEECWDIGIEESSSSFIINLPTTERLKEERQSKLGEVLRKARGMKRVDEWNVSPEERPRRETPSFLGREDASTFQCPPTFSDNKCQEDCTTPSEEPQCQRASPSLWDSGDESFSQSPPKQQSFNDNQLSNEERRRHNEIQKLREMEQRRNLRERDEIRAVESFQRRRTAMENRKMETSSRFRTRSTSRNAPATSSRDKKPAAAENADLPWDACELKNVPDQPPTENVWNKRMAVQNLRQEIMPSTVDDEEEMLQKAIQLSQIQYVEDEKARFKIFEGRVKEETVPVEESQKPTETPTSSSQHYFPSHTDFTRIKTASTSSSNSRSLTEDDLTTSELSSSSDTNNESHRPGDASTPEEQKFSCFNRSRNRFPAEDIKKPTHSAVEADEEFSSFNNVNNRSHNRFNSGDIEKCKESVVNGNQEFGRLSTANKRSQNSFNSRDIEKPVHSFTDEKQELGSFSAANKRSHNSFSAGDIVKRKDSIVDGNQEFSSFGAVNDRRYGKFTTADIDKPVQISQREVPSVHSEVNLNNSEKSSSSKVKVNVENIPSLQSLHLGEAFAKVEKPVSVARPEATLSNLQANSDISKFSPQALPSAFPKAKVTRERSSSNSSGNNSFERSSVHSHTSDFEQASRFRVVNHCVEQSANTSRANTKSDLRRPFSEPKVTSSHIPDTGFEEPYVANSDTLATTDIEASPHPVINSALPPFPKFAATVTSATSNRISTKHNVDPTPVQLPDNCGKLLENSNDSIDTSHPQATRLPVEDVVPPISATGHEEKTGASVLGNSSSKFPSSEFVISPPPPTVMENQNYLNASTAGPNPYVPPSGFPYFPTLSASGLAMPNNFFPAPAFSFPVPSQLAPSGVPVYPQVFASCLPASYRKLMELPPETPAMSNLFPGAFLPTQYLPNPYAAAMGNPFPTPFLPMQSCLNPDAPAMGNAFPVHAMENHLNPQTVHANDRPAESYATVPQGDSDLEQPLSSSGRGIGFGSRSHEPKNDGVHKVNKEKVNAESLLGPPPKDFRLRKRWEKQVEALKLQTPST